MSTIVYIFIETTIIDIFNLSSFVDMLELRAMNIQASNDLGALIRDRRNKLGITQGALADKAGVSRAWIVALEQGKPSAQIDLVLRTLRELGLTLMVDLQLPASSSRQIDLGAILKANTKKA
jgi:HTH-type transcriptional regulator/antitoxin HipB